MPKRIKLVSYRVGRTHPRLRPQSNILLIGDLR
ncbi:hypothetical protein ES332_D09G130600v1 [Gossypium tomentosum]|uniref:Uncharacterized protein n=1 Tax=Gossypium tomentosum TaxID=34277 RepID=A0A5D2JG70_GOSTO|nr:hypothetical protein ES332_D09G130600v1 [Gossypium tomentosum]